MRNLDFVLFRDVMLQIKKSGKVNGVFLAYDPSKPPPPAFTHEDSCPNRYSGLSSLETQTCGSDLYPTWNPKGTGLLLENWGMPIFFSNNATHLEDLFAVSQKITPQSLPLLRMSSNVWFFCRSARKTTTRSIRQKTKRATLFVP